MIVCLDTNVFVSGILWEGAPSHILELWIDDKFEVVISPAILVEYEFVLRRFEKKMPRKELLGWIDFAKSRSRLVTPPEGTGMTCRDPTDEKFLMCALEGRANYLITGDKDLLGLQQELPFKIIRPASFLRRLVH